MPDYRLYFFKDGHIEKARDLTADNDMAAIEKARTMAGDQPAELWLEAVKLHIFNPVF